MTYKEQIEQAWNCQQPTDQGIGQAAQAAYAQQAAAQSAQVSAFHAPWPIKGPAIIKIEARLRELGSIHANYAAYQRDRVAESDHHGAWDAAINLAETEAEQAGLRFALAAIDAGRGPSRWTRAAP